MQAEQPDLWDTRPEQQTINFYFCGAACGFLAIAVLCLLLPMCKIRYLTTIYVRSSGGVAGLSMSSYSAGSAKPVVFKTKIRPEMDAILSYVYGHLTPSIKVEEDGTTSVGKKDDIQRFHTLSMLQASSVVAVVQPKDAHL